MSGRIRRLLRTVPTGRVDLGEVPRLAATPITSPLLSPARHGARSLLAERLRGVDPKRCRVVGPGRLVDATTMPFACPTGPLAAAEGAIGATPPSWLVVGDALAAEPDPTAALSRLAAFFTAVERPRFVVLLPGTALLPDDTPPCPRRWLFSRVSGERLAAAAFGNLPTDVATVGNVLIASSEVLGLAARDLWADELDFVDPQYPVIVALTTRPAGA
jgi:hypothetical protein